MFISKLTVFFTLLLPFIWTKCSVAHHHPDNRTANNCDKFNFVHVHEHCDEQGNFPIQGTCEFYFNCTGKNTGEKISCGDESLYFDGHSCTLIPHETIDYCLQQHCLENEFPDENVPNLRSDDEPWESAPHAPNQHNQDDSIVSTTTTATMTLDQLSSGSSRQYGTITLTMSSTMYALSKFL